MLRIFWPFLAVVAVHSTVYITGLMLLKHGNNFTGPLLLALFFGWTLLLLRANFELALEKERNEQEDV